MSVHSLLSFSDDYTTLICLYPSVKGVWDFNVVILFQNFIRPW